MTLTITELNIHAVRVENQIKLLSKQMELLRDLLQRLQAKMIETVEVEA